MEYNYYLYKYFIMSPQEGLMSSLDILRMVRNVL